MHEKPYSPFWKDLSFRWHPDGPSLPVDDVVGITVERDKAGYATRVCQSDGVAWQFPRDLSTFLTTPDSRLFFVDGTGRELEPILKHLGEKVCTDLADGCTVDAMSYSGSALRIKNVKSVWSLKPFYTADLLPLENETDCYGVQARGEKLVKSILGANMPLRLHSCGSLLDGGDRGLPFMTAPAKVAELAYNCYHGGWIEAMKLGYFPEAFDYDISSAYPTEAAGLISCSNKHGYWIESREYVNDAFYGFCYCKIRLDITLPMSPLMIRIRSGLSSSGRFPIRTIRNPVGFWQGWVTKEEIEFIVDNWLGEVDILEGQWFIPTHYYHPFRDMVSKLKEVRRQGECGGDRLIKNIGKLTAATIQGKMMQSYLVDGKRVTGNAFNPVYAASLTSRVRVKMAEIALDNWNNILMVMVDGILSKAPLAVPKHWRLAHSGECIVANHGDYSIPNRRVVSKLRRSLEDSPLSTTYAIHASRYESISESLEGGVFEYAGRVKPETRIRVSHVGKRYWPNLPYVCEDLLVEQFSSQPAFMSEGMKPSFMLEEGK